MDKGAAAFLDVDNTLRRDFLTPDFITFLHDRGKVDRASYAKFIRLMEDDPRRDTDYEPWAEEVVHSQVDVFVGRNAEHFARDLRDFGREVPQKILPVTRRLLHALDRQGLDLVLVTGGHEFIAESLQPHLGVDTALAGCRQAEGADGLWEAEFEPGYYMDGADKKSWIEASGFDLTTSVAVGDSASDLPMFEAVGRGILIVNDKTSPKVLRDAQALGALPLRFDASVIAVDTVVHAVLRGTPGQEAGRSLPTHPAHP